MATSLHDDSAYNKKTVLYVGGLDDAATEQSLHAAFIAFGEIVNLHIAVDAQTKKTRGFGFVEFEDPTDAAEAMDNMNDNEFFGRVLKVNVARPDALRNKAIWAGAQADQWYANLDGKPAVTAPAMIVKIGADGKPLPNADADGELDDASGAATATDAKDQKGLAPPPGLTAAGTAAASANASAATAAATEATKSAAEAMAAEAAAREAAEGRAPKRPRLSTQEKRAQKKALKAEAHNVQSGMKPMSARELGLDLKYK